MDEGAPLNNNITYTTAVAEVITISMIAAAIMAKIKHPLATITTTVTACPQTNMMNNDNNIPPTTDVGDNGDRQRPQSKRRQYRYQKLRRMNMGDLRLIVP